MSLRISRQAAAICGDDRLRYCELIWTADRKLDAGTVAELRSENGLGCWGIENIYVDGADVILRAGDEAAPKGLIVRFRLPYELKKGRSCRMRFGLVPPYSVEDDLLLCIFCGTQSGEFIKEEDEAIQIQASAGFVSSLRVFVKPASGEDGLVRVVISPEDSCGNPAGFVKPVKLFLNWEGDEKVLMVSKTCALSLPEPDFVGRIHIKVLLRDLNADECIDNGNVAGDSVTVTSNPVWNRSQTKEQALIGDLSFSFDEDGTGKKPLQQCLKLAKNFMNLDFAAACGTDVTGKDWRKITGIAQSFDEKEGFITLFGYNIRTEKGVDNYYFAGTGMANLLNSTSKLAPPFKELLFKGEASFSVVDPRNDASFTQKKFDFEEAEDCMRLIEVLNGNGNLLRHTTFSELEAGNRKVGFAAGSHNKLGWPGKLEVGKGSAPGQVLTGVWVKEKSRKGLFKGLYDRHTWAMMNTRAILMFTINDKLMGEEITVKTGESIVAWIALSAESPIKRLAVYSDRGVVYKINYDKADLDVEVPLEALLEERTTYYYLKVEFYGGGVAMSSPVYVKARKRILDNLLAFGEKEEKPEAEQAALPEPETQSLQAEAYISDGYQGDDYEEDAEYEEVTDRAVPLKASMDVEQAIEIDNAEPVQRERTAPELIETEDLEK